MRIVSLLASGTEIVCALGAGDELVGRSHECDNPPWVRRLPSCTCPAFDTEMSSRDIDTEVRRRLKEKLPLFHIDLQQIEALKPDLLITQAHCEVCAVTPGDVERAGCNSFASQVLALQAGTLDGIYDGIASVAEAIGRAGAGRDLVQRLKNRADFVREQVRSRPTPTVIVLEWPDPVFAMGNWGPELVEIANGKLLLGEPGQHSRAIEWSEVREADPQYLIVAPCGFNLQRAQREVSVLKRNSGWSELRAVRENKVICADGNLYFNRSGTTVIETAEIIADILHGTRLRSASQQNVWRVAESPEMQSVA